jgi:hypothetical protein
MENGSGVALAIIEQKRQGSWSRPLQFPGCHPKKASDRPRQMSLVRVALDLDNIEDRHSRLQKLADALGAAHLPDSSVAQAGSAQNAPLDGSLGNFKRRPHHRVFNEAVLNNQTTRAEPAEEDTDIVERRYLPIPAIQPESSRGRRP